MNDKPPQISPDQSVYLNMLHVLATSKNQEDINSANILLKQNIFSNPIFVLQQAASTLFTDGLLSQMQALNLYIIRNCLLPKFNTPLDTIRSVWFRENNLNLRSAIKKGCLGFIASTQPQIQSAAAAATASVYQVELSQWDDLIYFIQEQIANPQLSLNLRYGAALIIKEVFLIKERHDELRMKSSIESIIESLLRSYNITEDENYLFINTQALNTIVSEKVQYFQSATVAKNALTILANQMPKANPAHYNVIMDTFEKIIAINFTHSQELFPFIMTTMMKSFDFSDEQKLIRSIAFWSNLLHPSDHKIPSDALGAAPIIQHALDSVIPRLIAILEQHDADSAVDELVTTIEKSISCMFTVSKQSVFTKGMQYATDSFQNGPPNKAFTGLVLLSSFCSEYDPVIIENINPNMEKLFEFVKGPKHLSLMSLRTIHRFYKNVNNASKYKEANAFHAIIGLINEFHANPEIVSMLLIVLSSYIKGADWTFIGSNFKQLIDLMFQIIKEDILKDDDIHYLPFHVIEILASGLYAKGNAVDELILLLFDQMVEYFRESILNERDLFLVSRSIGKIVDGIINLFVLQMKIEDIMKFVTFASVAREGIAMDTCLYIVDRIAMTNIHQLNETYMGIVIDLLNKAITTENPSILLLVLNVCIDLFANAKSLTILTNSLNPILSQAITFFGNMSEGSFELYVDRYLTSLSFLLRHNPNGFPQPVLNNTYIPLMRTRMEKVFKTNDEREAAKARNAAVLHALTAFYNYQIIHPRESAEEEMATFRVFQTQVMKFLTRIYPENAYGRKVIEALKQFLYITSYRFGPKVMPKLNNQKITKLLRSEKAAKVSGIEELVNHLKTFPNSKAISEMQPFPIGMGPPQAMVYNM